MASKSLGAALRKLAGRIRRRHSMESHRLTPEALLDLRIDHLEKQIEEVKARVNALMLIILAAVITDVVMRALT